jgi:23S rRNA (uracil1939-C5)-methyltransferase
MKFELENKAKQGILEETFDRAGLKGLSFKSFVFGEQQFGYRNKMEIGFWGDENGIHLAHYIRATHGKQIVVGSKLANNNINNASADFIKQINKLSQTVPLRAGDLKTVVFRCSRAGAVVSALFIKKDIDFSSFELPNSLKGLVVYYSNPKSLASIPTKKLYSFGDIKISDTVMDNNITYDVMSFFQVNVSVFEKALEQMKNFKKELPSIDMYSGVGTIGIVLGSSELVESEESNVIMAKLNAKGSLSKVVHLNSEEALDYVTKDKILILDPPRAGLHKKIIDRIAEVQPAQIMYLSCNPSTQARDVKLLEDYYKITHAQGFNFFPRTPHIESLVILERK